MALRRSSHDAAYKDTYFINAVHEGPASTHITAEYILLETLVADNIAYGYDF
eukprot:CAMPEP_0113303420 /NCGR_PEP_ID=MMETSP0010_2-20120614/3846_1 /TAXON_ID=216773 ORGANISM="Corethron hystrix, Strain 308" /NCGR_SAMPLE_ID=MMETSP0010_2 /ASSEMBLY_ACC=CAM_ASM_000155 /LENGTH=51 /DNA_ID=CAMNT_0000157419 /DNA_START=1281 /DNA_END=1436 /DNA_ORIENTATION=+ /assembly_acc=CAM_ASM_000155